MRSDTLPSVDVSTLRPLSQRPFIQHYVFDHEAEPAWTGPVERPVIERLPSIHLTWRCQNPHCGHWTMNGAFRTGRCNFCFTPRTPDQ